MKTEEQDALEVKYGLPREVKFCARCVISNQRPNTTIEYKYSKDSKKETIHFDAEGVCAACRVAEEKKKIDWAEREKQLKEVCDRFRKNDGSYDCIVPGSGGKDSAMTSHMLKFKYGMNPLTVTWAPHLYTDWGWKNFQAWVASGFDNYLFTPNGRVHRLLTRLATENLFHPFQPFILGQKTLAPRIALLYDIPLIFYGENEAEYGSPVKGDPSKQSSTFFAMDHSNLLLGGTPVSELKKNYGLTANDLDVYMPVDPQKINDRKIEVHYFGYYVKWHLQSSYYYAVENTGFQASPERTAGTYSKYSSIDDKVDDLHFYTTFIKFGIGRASTDASQEIRSNDITRDEGVALVKRFDGEYPARFEKELFQYLSIPAKEYPAASKMFEKPVMTRETFMERTDRARSPHLWKKENGEWKLRHAVWH